MERLDLEGDEVLRDTFDPFFLHFKQFRSVL